MNMESTRTSKENNAKNRYHIQTSATNCIHTRNNTQAQPIDNCFEVGQELTYEADGGSMREVYPCPTRLDSWM